MNNQGSLLLLTSALGAIQPIQAFAATVTYTVPANISVNSSSSPYFLDVAPDIVDADSLLSISGGTISGSEGSSFTISARFDTGPDQQIYQFTFPFEGSTVTRGLTIVPTSSISSGFLTGLVFTFNRNLNIPAGTVFSFNSTAIPEPASATLWMAGGAAALHLTRRRRRDSAECEETPTRS